MVSNNHLVFRSSVFTHCKITVFLRHDALPPPTFFKTIPNDSFIKKIFEISNTVIDRLLIFIISVFPKLFATDGVVYTEPLYQNFLAFVDYISCCADTYVSLGGSNGCANQLTNWDGTQKIGLGAPTKRKVHGLSQ